MTDNLLGWLETWLTISIALLQEIKALARPEFEKYPERFYPVTTLTRFGFSRAQCPNCKHFFWRHSEKVEVCGDSQCVGKYSFIGVGCGKGKKGKKITYAEAWNSFRTSFENARVPHTAVRRYPTVARWRADVDYTAAGIYCYQPYCVTGELDPPANPLIQPQFCLRFNDLDCIGLTGRHYSGFIMMGIQVFNTPQKYVYFKEEVVEFNLTWLIEELEIDPDEITLIEDVWAGGGNLGPSIEYFIGGLELGNMVFMQFKTFPDGSRQDLAVQVIDVGIGLERVPWLINGTPTSYVDTFPTALPYLADIVGVDFNNPMWEKFGPYSCLLNVDEVDDMEATWQKVAGKIGVEKSELMANIEVIRDLYIVCDHTRAVLMPIEDGSLPSNVGGASNVRNILRRVFFLLHKHDWMSKLTLPGLIKLFDYHRADLTPVIGAFQTYDSFAMIITKEYERWQTTDRDSATKVQRLQKKKGGKLSLEDWITAHISYGLDADKISSITGEPVPDNFYYELATLAERQAPVAAPQLYDTTHLPPTEEMFYATGNLFELRGAKVVALMPNVQQKNRPNLIVLDRTLFYPTSGGQLHDTGSITIGGNTYQVVDCWKVGKCIVHVLDKDVEGDVIGTEVTGQIDAERRIQLRNHHTSAHIISAACRKVLGPHVWQQGAKKSPVIAHLDITHYESLTPAQERAIENEANRTVRNSVPIAKFEMPKEKAEERYGFHLYQGGVVPGNKLRIVDINGIDEEACCGTHADNTSEVGFIRVVTTRRVADGIVRLYFVAGERAMSFANDENDIVTSLTTEWSIPRSGVLATASRFFDGYKRAKKLSSTVSELSIRLAASEALISSAPLCAMRSDQPDINAAMSFMPSRAVRLKEAKKSLVIVGPSWMYGILSDPSVLDLEAVKKLSDDTTSVKDTKVKSTVVKNSVQMRDGKKKVDVAGLVQFQNVGIAHAEDVWKLIAGQADVITL